MAGLFAAKRQQKAFRLIPLAQIAKNPGQPRKIFDAAALQSLADSISRYGVISPLSVRRTADGYELIAGERRLRAAEMAGLREVPCYIMEASEEDSSLMALVENLQRKDLDFFEEAASLRRLTQRYGLTQEQAARRIGKTQSAVANKLRLLSLSPETVSAVRSGGLTERHARALLRLSDERAQLAAAEHIAARGLNVEQAERYIEALLRESPPQQQRRVMVRDVRIFMNTLRRAMQIMRESGYEAEMAQRTEGGVTEIVIRLPQRPAAR